MKIRVYQSGKGDCLLLTSESAKPVRILVDGGLREPFLEHVAPDLAKLKAPLDVVYVSHIDDDHIAGVLQFMDDLIDWRVYDYQKKAKNPKAKLPPNPRPPGAKKLWQNSFHELLKDNSGPIDEMLGASTSILAASTLSIAPPLREMHAELALSKAQALKLARRVGPDQLGIAVNPEVKHKLLLLRGDAPVYKVGTIKFHLLGPTQKNLRELRDEWDEWIRESQDQIKKIQRQAKIDEDRLGTDVERLLRPLTMNADVFAKMQLEFAKKLGDRNKVTLPNLASLMFLAIEGKQRVLLTGDGHSNDVVKGLKTHGVLDTNGQYHVAVMKVPHHGSEHNITPEFCRDITADTYVFCGNGAHSNPELDVLKTIAEKRQKALPTRPFKFWFNCDPADKHNDYQAHMKKVQLEVQKLKTASKGLLKAEFVKGSFFDL
jgi:beta-lactamase superfamily II metal-dependent hydrolase